MKHRWKQTPSISAFRFSKQIHLLFNLLENQFAISKTLSLFTCLATLAINFIQRSKEVPNECWKLPKTPVKPCQHFTEHFIAQHQYSVKCWYHLTGPFFSVTGNCNTQVSRPVFYSCRSRFDREKNVQLVFALLGVTGIIWPSENWTTDNILWFWGDIQCSVGNIWLGLNWTLASFTTTSSKMAETVARATDAAIVRSKTFSSRWF